jgi:ankyrin repeat protein
MIPIKVKNTAQTKYKITNVSAVSKFQKACGDGKSKDVLFALDNGIDIEARGEDSGWTALQWASAFGRTAVVELLLTRGASINVTNDVRTQRLVCDSMSSVFHLLFNYFRT